MPNVQETLSSLPWEDGLHLGVASNQGGVALGYLDRDLARNMLVDMAVEAIGFLPSRTYIELCTCSSRVECDSRKPAPGMLLRILEQSGVSAKAALFVGDLDKDREAAHRAGIAFIWAKDFFGWSAARSS